MINPGFAFNARRLSDSTVKMKIFIEIFLFLFFKVYLSSILPIMV